VQGWKWNNHATLNQLRLSLEWTVRSRALETGARAALAL